MVDRAASPRPENVFVLMPAYNAGATVEKVFERIPAESAGDQAFRGRQ